MTYLRSFIPWLAFAAISTADWRWGAAVALFAAGSSVLKAQRTGEQADLLTVSTAVFFAALTAVAFARPDSGLRDWTGAASLGWLGVTAWASLAAGKPFTLVIAKRSVPREVWGLPGFHKANVVITAVWAASFTVTAGILVALRASDVHSGVVSTAVQVVGFVIPVVFTAKYPEYVRNRSQRAAA
ncbi:hypothetical protein [Yinghuangia seranimata]|uniref:hypothetical protein n=1 Tax=Yinghuangia seranimata TaxID=408067 RepID=UPI00248AB95F|nr:hypothetical protein [Yinghuangia seranimata]MDI2130840.1 hypothetical protein [Yinghuangia seranimata]